MKRMIAAAVALGALVLFAMIPALLWGHGSEEDVVEPTTIVSYTADFTVDDDGSMEAVESVTVLFPEDVERRGIFRFFDRHDPNATRLRRDPQDVKVTMDGQPVEVELSTEGRERFLVARVGSEDVIVQPGEHTYRISYRIDDVLLPDGDGSRLVWDVIPGGWQQEIEEARVTVQLPEIASASQCDVGWGRSGGCTVVGDDSHLLAVDIGPLPSRTPVTLAADVAHPVEQVEHRPWPMRWDRVLGPSVPALLGVLAAAAAAGVVGYLLVRPTLEPKPGFPLQYAPPPGIGPAQATLILDERLSRDAFVATLLDGARQGAYSMERQDDGSWRIDNTGDQDAWDRLDPATRRVGELLRLWDQGSFVATPRDTGAGRVLDTARRGMREVTERWAREGGLMGSAGVGTAGGWLVIGAALLAVLLVVFNVFDMSLVSLIPGAFAAFGLGMLATGASTRRTAAGRDLWSRIGGFRRVLSTPSSQDRFEFSSRQELYTAYIPWAVAFGVADEWAEKWRTEMGSEPPVPTYFAGDHREARDRTLSSQLVSSFDSAVSSAVSSYTASQSSSRGGGSRGGGGGGRGGGGGGGGSW